MTSHASVPDDGVTFETLRTRRHAQPKDATVLLCAGCVRAPGRCRLGLRDEHFDDSVNVLRYRARCGAEYEGGPGVAHGGWTAAALDEVLGHFAIWQQQLTVTGTLHITYRRPVPLEEDLTLTSWLDRREGTRWFVHGDVRLAHNDEVLATAEGVFVERDDAHFERHRAWLATVKGEGQS